MSGIQRWHEPSVSTSPSSLVHLTLTRHLWHSVLPQYPFQRDCVGSRSRCVQYRRQSVIKHSALSQPWLRSADWLARYLRTSELAKRSHWMWRCPTPLTLLRAKPAQRLEHESWRRLGNHRENIRRGQPPLLARQIHQGAHRSL